jgi:glycosyltransferase involved in cell wall biosynthesis
LQNHVEWKGYVEQDELYAQTDILLSCAQSEGFGRTLVEAMGRGIPVVARRQGGPAEIIQDMQTGYLYDDIREAIEKIQLCIVENQSRIECISSAREYARTHFSIENYLEKVSATMLR